MVVFIAGVAVRAAVCYTGVHVIVRLLHGNMETCSLCSVSRSVPGSRAVARTPSVPAGNGFYIKLLQDNSFYINRVKQKSSG